MEIIWQYFSGQISSLQTDFGFLTVILIFWLFFSLRFFQFLQCISSPPNIVKTSLLSSASLAPTDSNQNISNEDGYLLSSFFFCLTAVQKAKPLRIISLPLMWPSTREIIALKWSPISTCHYLCHCAIKEDENGCTKCLHDHVFWCHMKDTDLLPFAAADTCKRCM